MKTETLTQTIIIPDRNENKFLLAWGFIATPVPRDANTLDFKYEATDALFDARRAYSLNQSVNVLSFIEASRYVDKLIYEHRQCGGVK